MSPRRIEQTAYHEAGHFVMMEVFKIPVSSITLLGRRVSERECSWAGQVNSDFGTGDHTLAIAVSGPIAESIFLVREDQCSIASLEPAQVEQLIKGFCQQGNTQSDGVKVPFHTSTSTKREVICGKPFDRRFVRVYVGDWDSDFEQAKPFLSGNFHVHFNDAVAIVEKHWTRVTEVATAICDRAQSILSNGQTVPIEFEVVKDE